MAFYKAFSRLEKILISLFTIILFLSGSGLIRAFYLENTELQPAVGGEFTEGMVGAISPDYHFNPLFADGLETDVTELIFTGLMEYDAKTGTIEDFLATHTLSPDKRVYEFTLKNDLLWHDGQPLTADDVVFTYRDVIQHPDFQGQLLKQAFQDVSVERIDDRTVRFTIPEKRKTFFTNFTLGLLPRHILGNVPVAELINHQFNQQPVGNGPYRFEGVLRDGDTTQVRLAAFPDYFLEQPKIETIQFNIYPTFEKLAGNVNKLDVIRPIQKREAAQIPSNQRFNEIEVIGPRYLAVFFNLKTETLTTKKIRQAMRAAVNTDQLAEKYAGERVDTPLVELWPQNDIVNVSFDRAEELMREAGYLTRAERNPIEPPPEEAGSDETEREPAETITEEQLLPAPEQAPTEEPVPAPEPETPASFAKAEYVYEPFDSLRQATGQNEFYLVGSFPEGTSGVRVNGYRLQLFNAASGRFSYFASTSLGTLSQGENVYNVEFLNSASEIIDSESVTVVYEPNADALAALQAELAGETNNIEPERDQQEALSEETPVAENNADKGEQENAEENIDQPAEPEDQDNNEEEFIESEEMADDILEDETEAADGIDSSYRTNDAGEHVKLTLTYLESFDYIASIASDLEQTWQELGIELILDPVDPEMYREKIRTRNYEIILMAQDMGYNLDAYPYFHLSQAEENKFNVANWKNLEASVLLEEIRSTHNTEKRIDNLRRLTDIIIDDVPGIFLFTPKYVWMYDDRIQNVDVNHMVNLADRYSHVYEMYTQKDRLFREEVAASDFFPWFLKNSGQLFSLSST
jgi:peptide/nickel transport system substrate-binding protein